jgi:type II secretory pathway component HofQ
MHKRLRLTAILALLAVAPSAGAAQAISVSFFDAKLSEIVRNFAAFSGRTIVLAPEAGNPAVTASIRDVEWRRGLDQILATQSLVARVDGAGVIHVEPRRSLRVTVQYFDAGLRQVVQNFAAYAGRTIVLAEGIGDRTVTASFRDVEWRSALDLLLAPHGLVARESETGIISIERSPPGR